MESQELRRRVIPNGLSVGAKRTGIPVPADAIGIPLPTYHHQASAKRK